MVKKKAKRKTVKKAAKRRTKADPRVCTECGKIHPVRKNLGLSATREETESLLLINNRINIAAQAARPVNTVTNATKEQIKLFVEAALEARAEATSLQRQWWKEITAKYNLPVDKNVFIDFNTCEFFLQE